MKHTLAIIALLILAGCERRTQPLTTVRVVSHNAGSGGGFYEQFVFKYPHTIVEDVHTGQRWVLKGLVGDVGDTFSTVLVEEANVKQPI